MTEQALTEDGIKHAVVSQTLVRIVKAMLTRVIQSSEEAVVEITEKIQSISTLSETQKDGLSEALEHFYHANDNSTLKQTLNDNATKIMNAAMSGDMGEVERIANDPEYNKARLATKCLHDRLQQIIADNQTMNEYIMPVILALQFQDRVRQELESINKSFEDYFDFVDNLVQIVFAVEPTKNFWKKIAQNFTNLDARTLILKTSMGDDYLPDEEDLRTSGVMDDGFFL
jgi:uncharacterized membrane protein YheB (UPF0754 family)